MKNQFCFILALSGSLFSSSLSYSQSTQAAKPAPDTNIKEYTVAAVLYQQQSGEYRALAWQAFELAKLRVNEAIKKPHKKPLAIITDLDETVLDNSAHQAQLIKDDTFYTRGSWKEWVNKQEADSIPGSVSFFQYAASFKVPEITIFYITNRDSADLENTIQNMKKLGFPQLGREHFMMNSDKGNKQKRREKVMRDYEVIMQLGDNLNDFSGDFVNQSYSERKRLTDNMHQHFGVDFIALPNAMYGDWEGALYNNNYRTPHQDSVRYSLLKGYK